LLERVPRWYRVRLGDGTTGFVSKSWVRVEKDLADRQSNEIRIHFLNIGAGTCTLVECPGQDAPPIVVDCGSLGGTGDDMTRDEAEVHIQAILKQHTEPPNVVLSHADQDHYGWISNVLKETKVNHIWQGGDPEEYTELNFPEWLVERVGEGSIVHRGFEADFSNDGKPLGSDLSCGDAETFLLTVNTGSNRNSESLVLLIEYRDFVAIFTGDAEGSTESAAIRNFPEGVKATVLSGSHHGASTHGSNSPDWAREAAPDIAIFSAGRRFFHPRCAAVEAYGGLAGTREHDTQCGDSGAYRPVETSTGAQYMTEINGRIIVTSNGESPLWLHCSRGTGCGVPIPH